jgi:hypothetical protein
LAGLAFRANVGAGVVQVTVGPLRSTLNVYGPAVDELVALSATVLEFVEAEAVSTPAATLVLRKNDASLVGSARPGKSEAKCVRKLGAR